MLRFSDGMEFDTTGAPRAVLKSDGWYVVGNGILMAVDDAGHAEQVIMDLRTEEQLRTEWRATDSYVVKVKINVELVRRGLTTM